MATKKKAKLVLTKKHFPLEVAVFEFPNEDSRPYHSVKLARSFRRDENSDWETTEIFLPLNLVLGACELLRATHHDVQDLIQKSYDERRQQNRREAAVDAPVEEEVAF